MHPVIHTLHKFVHKQGQKFTVFVQYLFILAENCQHLPNSIVLCKITHCICINNYAYHFDFKAYNASPKIDFVAYALSFISAVFPARNS